MIQELHDILVDLYNKAEKPFSGIGLLVCDDVKNLPLFPLYKSNTSFENDGLLERLMELTDYKNKFHDGFHVVSTSLKITHTSQYFYPKPTSETSLEVSEGHGVRYFVAKIGSKTPNVLYTAIVGSNYGVCIFKDGQEIKVGKHD